MHARPGYWRSITSSKCHLEISKVIRWQLGQVSFLSMWSEGDTAKQHAGRLRQQFIDIAQL